MTASGLQKILYTPLLSVSSNGAVPLSYTISDETGLNRSVVPPRSPTTQAMRHRGEPVVGDRRSPGVVWSANLCTGRRTNFRCAARSRAPRHG